MSALAAEITRRTSDAGPQRGGLDASGDGPAKPLRIAVLSPVWFPIPPIRNGATATVVALLLDGLVEAGPAHDKLGADVDVSVRPGGGTLFDVLPSSQFLIFPGMVNHAEKER